MDLINPLDTEPLDAPLLPALREALVEELEKRGRIALLALLPVLVMLWAILRRVAEKEPRVAWLLAIIIAVGLTRNAVQMIRTGSPKIRHLRFTLGSTLIAVLLGTLTWITFPALTPIEQGLMGMCIAGISSAALVSMAASPTTFVAYLVPLVGTLGVSSFLHPVPEHPIVYQLVCWFFLLGLGGLSLRVHRSLRDEILLRLRSSDLALKDSLTGLYNRRFLSEFMARESAAAMRAWSQPEGRRLTIKLMMVDLDHFKRVNDEYGHAAGDAVLKQLGDLLVGVLRKPDVVTRWGGEEFVVVARDTGRVLPLGLAARLLQRVESHPFRLPDGQVLRMTCSIGFALHPFLPDDPHRLAWEDCLTMADAGLYLAKARGRNRWVGIEAGTAAWGPGEAIARISAEPEACAKEGLVRLVDDGPNG